MSEVRDPRAGRRMMIGWKLYGTLILADAALLGGLIFAIFYLRRKHPGHVFTIWYAFWLMLILYSSLFYYVWENARTIHASPLSGNAFLGQLVIWFTDASMNFREEGYLIGSIYIIVLLPQFMSYIFSGLFGCANRLTLVGWINAALTWLLIKFLAVLAGILMAQAIASLYARPLVLPSSFPIKLLQSIMMISLSFIIAGTFYLTYEYRFKRLLVKIRRPLKPRTRHMRHYTVSAEAREARKQRYAWLRRRIRKLATNVLWS
jgi:hypothetical protein